MLVLSRKVNQKIRIGNDIVITIVNISESSVKIGIEAPNSVKILRDELYESVKQQVSEAQKSTVTLDLETIKQLKDKFKK
jgi:carbon storage regulator